MRLVDERDQVVATCLIEVKVALEDVDAGLAANDLLAEAFARATEAAKTVLRDHPMFLVVEDYDR